MAISRFFRPSNFSPFNLYTIYFMSIFSPEQIIDPTSLDVSLPTIQPETGFQIPTIDIQAQEAVSIQNDQEFADRINEFSRFPEDDAFRPQLAERLSVYRQKAILDNYVDPATKADRDERRKKAEDSLDLLRDWDTDTAARKRVEARWGSGFIERVRNVSPEDRDEMLGTRLMMLLGDNDSNIGFRDYKSRNNLWGQGIVSNAQVWRHFQASNHSAVDEETKAIQTARSIEQQLPMIAEELWKGNSMLQVLDKMPELDATSKVFLLTNCGYGSAFHEDVEDARQWAAKNGIQLTVSDEEMKRMEAQGWGTWDGGDAYIHPYGLSDEERRKKADKMVFNNGAYELGKKLVELKAHNENAFNFVVGSLLSRIDRERNNGTAVLSPLAATFESMMESSWDFTRDLGQGPGRSAGLPGGMNSSLNAATDLNFTSRASDRTSDKEAEVISQIRAIKQSVSESPDGASWWRRFGDGLGRMAAQTAFFVGTQGVGTFAALSNDRIEELRGQGIGEMEATLRGFAAGGTEVLVERLGGESLFKTLRLLGKKMPFASRFAGYMGSATDMMKRGLYKSAAARYGTASLASGGSEWLEEVIQPTLQAPLDAGLAHLFGSDNGMTVEDWKGQLAQAADPMLALQMVAFGAVTGGAQIPAFAREAQISRVSAPQIMGLGVGKAEAERIASIVDPVEKNREIFQAALSMSDRGAQLENVRTGFRGMQEDFSWLSRQEAYQAEVELLNLPHVEDLGDGNWRFTTTVRDAEGTETNDVLDLNERDATARMQALLHDGVRARMMEAQQAFVVSKTIDQLSASGKYVFEDMGRAETMETARKLAEAARLRIANGVDVNTTAADLGTQMTYGQAAGMDSTFEGRVKLGMERGEVSTSQRAHSNAYRVAMKNGQTLIRFHKGEVTVPELLEEVLETHLTEDMDNTKHSLDWYTNNLRALQDALRKEGYLGKGKDLIRKDGEVTVRDVIEGMSMLAKGDVLARAADMRLPQWMKDFLQMVRQWVSSAKALLDLGTGLHEMERRAKAGEQAPITEDFAQTVHALSNNLESYWMEEGARHGEQAVQKIVDEVGTGVSMSLSGDSFLAPNGMPSNLTPEQYRQVRTPEFKNWFGDWEHDPENASKVVDQNGEPKVVYHGTPNEFTIFRNTQQNDAGWLGKGYYFYGVERESHGYMGKKDGHLMALFLNVRDPYYLNEEEHDELVERDDVDFSAEFTERIREEGYDGVSYSGDLRQEWMAMEPTQIKSATDNRGTFDPKNPDITFSLASGSESVAEVATAWKRQLDDYVEGKLGNKRRDLRVGPTPSVLRMLGAKAYDLVITPAVLDKVTAGKHAVPVSELERLPEALHKPIAVFESVTQGDSMVVLTELKEGKSNVVVAVHLNASGGFIQVNRIASLYGKDNPRALLSMPLLYLDNKKAGSVMGTSRLQLPTVIPSRNRTGAKVMNPKDLYKWKVQHELPTETFSISEDSPLRVSRGTQNLEVVHRIAADLRADAATWGRYDGKTDEAAFLVNVGRNVSLVKSALMHLPAGYRVSAKPYIDRLQILAELAAKGKIDETKLVNAFARREIKRELAAGTVEEKTEAEATSAIAARVAGKMTGRGPTRKFTQEVFEDEMEQVRKAWAEKRLHELMAEVMEKAAAKLEELAKDGITSGIAKMLNGVLKVRKKNGKQQRGKISAEAYAYLADEVVPLLRMTAEEKEVAMNEAEAEWSRLEKEHPDQMDGEAVARMEELNEELTRLALYGNLEGMSVDEAEAAAKALETYINAEKEGWASVQDAAAERLNAIGRQIVEKFNQTGKKADENTLRAANEKFHGKVSFRNFGDFMENMDQLLTRMGTMPALKEFTADMRSRLTNAFQQMRDARGLRAAAVQDLYEKHLTEKVMKARKVGNMAGWATWFKTSHDTGIRLNGWITQTAQLTVAQAREVREMDAQQRKEFIRKRWEEGMEYFSEETLDLLMTRLREHEEAVAQAKAEGKRPRSRKYVTAKVSFKGEEGSPLVLSRDNALYLVLQSEQESYREMMKQQGYTPEVVAALREYVGEEGMAIGYGLREILKVQGDKIGKLYEQVTGVPFPRVENYYPARFWALDAMSDADAADMISGVPSTKGGNQAWQKVRTKHHRRLDTSVGALSVFWEATDITDHWYYTQDITADFRGLLRRREVAESLVANLGKDDFVRLRRWVDLLERAGVVQGQAVGSLDKLLNAVYSGQAKAILAFRFETLLKQGSAVLNAWIGDPSIGFWDYLGTMAKMRNGTAEMGVIKMLKSAEFQARLNDRVDVETLSRLKDDSSYTLAEAALVWGMNGIEYTDVFFNAVGSAALWNIKYRQAIKAGVEEGRAKDEAWQAVRNALHSAQPQSWIDKSFGGLHRGTWGRAIFYMMSENYNKTAAIYGLARAGFAPGVTPRQRWNSLSKAGKVWLAYGTFNAIIGAMLDYMKDDEDEWEKRDWSGYLFAAFTGPFAGMPLVGEAVEWLFSELLGAKVYAGSAGRALIDFRSGWNAAWKLGEMIQDGGHEAGDYMKQVIRLGRVFGAAGGVASGMTNKVVQATGQYMTLGAALMNPVKTVVDMAD